MTWNARPSAFSDGAGAQERQVDQFDVHALILDRLGRVRDFDQLSRGLFRIAERRWLHVSHGLDAQL
jgi:hypothetical protein